MKTLITLACLLLAWSQAAAGYPALLGTVPAAGAVLEQVPHEIVLTFSEPVSPTAIRLSDPQGSALAVGAATDDGTRLRIPVPTATMQGTYRLSWRIATAGGRPLGGTLGFSVGATSAQPAATPARASAVRAAATWLSGWLIYLCVFAVSGAALFQAREPGGRQGWAGVPFVAGLVLLPVDLALQGLNLLDAPWTALFSLPPWKTALSGSYALTLVLLALALIAAHQALRNPATGLRRPVLAGAGVLLAGIALATSGYTAGSTLPRWLSAPTLVLHVAAAIAWAGALIPLYRVVTARQARPDAPDLALAPLAHFSKRIVWVVVLLILSGLLLMRLQLNGPGDLLQTDYGNVLLTKLVLVALVLLLAANRWRLTAAAQAGSAQARARLAQGIGSEIILLVGILAVVSLWHFTPPPDSRVALEEPPGATLVLEDRRVRALLEHPPGAGPWRVRLISIDGGTLDPRRVTLGLSNPATGTQPIARTLLKQPDGRWRADLPELPAGGLWHVRLAILTDNFDQITLQRDADLGPAATAIAPIAPEASAAPGGPQRGR